MPNPEGESIVMKKLNLRNWCNIIRAITLLCYLLLLSGVANAALIYNNLSSTSDGVDPVTGFYSPLFNSFSVGGENFNLLDVKLLLKIGQSSSSSSSVDLYSDSSMGPGKLLTTIGSLNDNELSGTLSVVDFPLASPYTLSANTRYWLVLTSTNNSIAEWSWSADKDALGVEGEYFGNGSGSDKEVYSNIYGPYQMQISDIPLPPSLLLFGSGLAGIGLLRLRKRFPV
jgi:hypothetical protein